MTNDACDEGEVDICYDDEPKNVISDHSARLVECGLSSRRVNIVQSPVLYTFYQHHPMALTLDTSAMTNMIRASTARLSHLPIKPASQIARQADGVTPLDAIGEVLQRHQRSLVVDVLAGNPFIVRDDIAVRPFKK